MLKAALAAVVGIWNLLFIKALAEISQTLQAQLLRSGADFARCYFVAAVHHQHQIEIFKILCRELPCALLAKVIITAQRMLLAASIWCLAHVVAVRAS